MHENDSGSSYVEKVREETQRGIRTLLADNENLRITLARLQCENERLTHQVDSLMRDIEEHRSRELNLQNRLLEVREASERHMKQFMELEQHNANLANLYVASHQLHGTFDRGIVLATIQEIIVNLIGSEEFVVLEKSAEGELRVACAVGAGEEHAMLLARTGEPDVVATIPLKLDGIETGMIVIFRLLAHKRALEPLDYELFDLLASHAATALYCTSLQERLRAAVVA